MEGIFISQVGMAMPAVISPLEQCLADPELRVRKVLLFYSAQTREHAEKILTDYAGKKVEAGAETWDSAGELTVELYPLEQADFCDRARAAAEQKRVLLNVNGGLGALNGKLAHALADQDLELVLSNKSGPVSLFNPARAELHRGEKRGEPLPVVRLLDMQGNKWEQNPEEGEFTKFCRQQRIRLPENRLENVRIGDLNFDLVWNKGNDRLCFLISLCTQDFAQLSGSQRTAFCRKVAAWSNMHDAKNQLFDRECYVIGLNNVVRDHLRKESQEHITVFRTYGLLREGVFSKYGADPGDSVPDFSGALRQELYEYLYFSDSFDYGETNRAQVGSDALIVMLGRNDEPTYKAIESHLKEQKLSRIYLCHTVEYSRTAAAVRAYYRSYAPEITVYCVKCDINGTSLLSQLSAAEGANNVQVNITPGTKAQGVMLMFWALQHQATAWSINQDQVVCLTDETRSPFAAKAFDPLALARLHDPTFYEELTESPALGEEYRALYEMLGKCCDQAGSKKELSAKYDSRDSQEHWTIELPDGSSFRGKQGMALGEWFEGFTAYALRQAGGYHVHSRVRALYAEQVQESIEQYYATDTVFRLDTDVLGAYRYGIFLMSCKAVAGLKWKLGPVASQALQTARGGISRFTIPLVVSLFEVGTEPTVMIPVEDAEKEVAVLDWRLLCNRQRLAEFLDGELQRASSTARGAPGQKKVYLDKTEGKHGQP